MAETKSYEDLVKKHSAPTEEKQQLQQKQTAASALRKKKNWLRSKVFAAVDATEAAQEAYELAVVSTDKTEFDTEFLAWKTAMETEKMYKEMYTNLFGQLPE